MTISRYPIVSQILACTLLVLDGLGISDVPAQSPRQQDDLAMMEVLTPTRPPRGRINAVDQTWEAWQKRTGELPPDFNTMRSHPFLPDPLEGDRVMGSVR